VKFLTKIIICATLCCSTGIILQYYNVIEGVKLYILLMALGLIGGVVLIVPLFPNNEPLKRIGIYTLILAAVLMFVVIGGMMVPIVNSFI